MMKFKAILFLGLAVLVASCGMLGKGGKGGNKASSKTGWEYNNPDNGGFQADGDFNQVTGPGLTFIEGGTFTMGRVEQDVMYD